MSSTYVHFKRPISEYLRSILLFIVTTASHDESASSRGRPVPCFEYCSLDIAPESLEKCNWNIIEDPGVTPYSIRNKISRSVYNVLLVLQLADEDTVHRSHSMYNLYDQGNGTI
jgi:formiminotetrahydrofolate cyclodeaminase